MSKPKLFKVKRLYNGRLGEMMERPAVIVRGSIIDEILTEEQCSRLNAEEFEMIDASGKCMMPGLIDTHTHLMLAGNGTTAEDTIAHNTEPELQLLGLRNAMLALNAGVTTLRDCGSGFGVSSTVKSFLEKGYAVGPDIQICGRPLTATGGHCHFMGGEVDCADEIIKNIRIQQKEGVDYIKIMATSGGTAGGPYGNTFRQSQLATAVEEAHRLGLRVTMHCYSIDGVRTAVAAGTDGIEHGMFVDEQYEIVRDDALAMKIADQGIFVCHTLPALGAALYELDRKGPSAWTEYDSNEYRRISALQEKVHLLLKWHYDCGIKCVAGSDAGWKYCGFDMGMKQVLTGMGACGIPNDYILYSATALAAQSMGVDNRVGTIEPGKQAEFLLLAEDPIEDIAAFDGDMEVYKGGVHVSSCTKGF